MDQMERLDRQFAFLREIDKEKEITRQNYLASGSSAKIRSAAASSRSRWVATPAAS